MLQPQTLFLALSRCLCVCFPSVLFVFDTLPHKRKKYLRFSWFWEGQIPSNQQHIELLGFLRKMSKKLGLKPTFLFRRFIFLFLVFEVLYCVFGFPSGFYITPNKIMFLLKRSENRQNTEPFVCGRCSSSYKQCVYLLVLYL